MSVTSNPKVLFVNHSSRLAGAEFVLRDIVKVFNDPAVFLFEDGMFRTLLQKQGTTVILASGSQDMSSVRRDSNLLKTALPLIGSIGSLIRQIIKVSRDYDIVYANSQKAFVLSAFASMITKKPLIWHCHDILSDEHFSKAQVKLDIYLATSRAKRVIVPSKATAKAFVKAGGNDEQVRVLYNGVAPLQCVSKLSKQELRNALQLPEGFIYGVFSRLAMWKGQHIAIEALKYLPEAYCVIVGDALFGEEIYAKCLRDVASDFSDRVIFLGHRDDVQTIMQAVDVYCHPSISPEPFSLALLEAMRAGLPIAATNAGGTPEVIVPGVTGLLAPPNNASAMAKILREFMLNSNLCKQVGANAQQLVTRDFTIPIMQNTAKIIITEAI